VASTDDVYSCNEPDLAGMALAAGGRAKLYEPNAFIAYIARLGIEMCQHRIGSFKRKERSYSEQVLCSISLLLAAFH